MKLVYTLHTEAVVGDKKSITPEKLDKMLLAIAKKMYNDGDITFKEKIEDEIKFFDETVKVYIKSISKGGFSNKWAMNIQ